MRREPRLQFTKEEQESPALEKTIRKADRAAARADKAQAKVPKRKVKQRTVDPETGTVTVRLQFEAKKPPSKLQHTLRDAPADTALGAVHREVRQSEADNVGLESAHKTEKAAESAGRLVRAGYRSHKLRPYRKAAAAERKLGKANVNALYQKSLQENPVLSSNPLSRWQQKQAIKRQYAAARRTGQTAATVGQTTTNTARSAKTAAKKSRQAADFARRHKKGFLVAAGLFLAVAFFLNCMSSCSVLVQGGMSGVAGTTYPSTDEAMLGAEDAYAGMEAELQDYLDTYESAHSYDEYHFDLDEIGHDPYVLISILTAYHQREWTLDEVQGTLDMLFEKQYILTERVVVETRYDSEGDPYSWYICYVTLENTDLSHLPVYIMGEEQLSMYAVYMATLGNRPDLFPQSQYPNASQKEDYLDYERVLHVLANTVRHKEWDGRISQSNKAWARTVPVFEDPDAWGNDRNKEFVVDRSHPGIIDLFVDMARHEYLLSQPLTKEDIHAEAARILSAFQAEREPNSPHGTHFMAQVDPDFLARARTKDHDRLMAMLPFQSLTLSGLEGRKGVYALITKDEDRTKPLRQRRPSVRRKLSETKTEPGHQDKKKAREQER